MSPPYMDQLDLVRQRVFKQLKAFKERFALAGGTAIMLHIGHRLSYDFDCFSEKELPQDLLRTIRMVFGPKITPLVDTGDILTVKTADGVELTFVFHPYKPLQKTIPTDSIPLFHLDDLAANKAYTIGRRGAWRDYVDLFFLLQSKRYSLLQVIDLAKKKFAGEFNEKLLLEQLTYFDDVTIVDTVFLKESYTISQIQSYLENQVEVYIKNQLFS